MSERPKIHVLAAYVLDKGEVWGRVHRVSLETAEWMLRLGYSVVGPDPHDLFDLAKWEKEHEVP